MLVGVDGLGGGDEADPAVVQLFDLVETVEQGAPEAIQLPYTDGIERPAVGIRHEAVQVRALRLGAADDVGVGGGDLPALAVTVGAEFPELRLRGPGRRWTRGRTARPS